MLGSTDRDEDVFPDRDLSKVERENAKKHLAFGVGEHLCLGNKLWNRLWNRLGFHHISLVSTLFSSFE